MVYRTDSPRHGSVPLRLGAAGTDAVLESLPVHCTHHDAFRFFTEAARPRNALAPRREDQLDLEQPGCLHATMDLYKWAYKLAPATPSELLGDCFALAVDVRGLDMRASPYDLAALGYPPVRIETPAGRAEYVRAQADFAERAAPLRERLAASDACCRLTRAPALPHARARSSFTGPRTTRSPRDVVFPGTIEKPGDAVSRTARGAPRSGGRGTRGGGPGPP